MLSSLRNMLKVPDLRNKILFTLFIIVIFRLGNHIPVPVVDTSVLENQAHGGFLELLSLFSGGGTLLSSSACTMKSGGASLAGAIFSGAFG